MRLHELASTDINRYQPRNGSPLTLTQVKTSTTRRGEGGPLIVRMDEQVFCAKRLSRRSAQRLESATGV
jgi:hypothetical protein